MATIYDFRQYRAGHLFAQAEQDCHLVSDMMSSSIEDNNRTAEILAEASANLNVAANKMGDIRVELDTRNALLAELSAALEGDDLDQLIACRDRALQQVADRKKESETTGEPAAPINS